ncbi:hypothetical protein FRC10_000561 [Ceratobasidium sp. 414]|nr:hypothetical protein FRC10_000561 [Ceratobasidium sp. 414]
MNAAHASFRPEEQPLILDVEFLHEIHDGRDPELSSTPTSTGTAVGSPAASIKLPAPAPTPLPMAKFSILLMLNAITPLAFELIYPFVNAWAAIKVMTGEMTDRSNQDLAFSSLQMTFRIGQIIGLPLGGLLAHPEQRFKIFHTPFWAAYPYLLPCLVGAAFALFSVIPGIIFIEETLPSKRKQRKITKRAPSYGSTNTTTSSTPTLVELPGDASPLHAPKLIDVESTENKPQATWCSVMTPPILALLLSNTLMCFVSETLFSVYPLFAYTPIASGGLGMSEGEIGIQMAIRSFIHIATMLGYNRIVGRFAMFLWPVVVLGFPILNWIVRTQPKGNESPVFFVSQLVFYTIWSVS